MRRTAVVSLAVLAVVAGVFAGPTPASAAEVPSAPYTALGLAVNVGTSQTGGAREASGAGVVTDTLSTTSVAAHAASGDPISLTLTPPSGTIFTTGATFGIDVSDSTKGTASVTSGDHACAAVTSGSVTIVEAVTGDADALTAFGADVDLACNDFRWVGYLRLNSSVGYTGVATSTDALAFPTVQLGNYTDLPVTLTATGTDDLPFITGATVGGENADWFSIVGDDCKDAALPAGASCTVTVRARPLDSGLVTGLVSFVHDGSTPYEVALTAGATDVAQGTYRAIGPTRAFDTRTGVGVRRGPIATNGVLRVPLGRFLPVPASAVVLNLTVDRPSKPSYLTAYPSGTARPKASSMNFPAGWQGANLVTVPLGVGNQIDIYNYLGNTPVLGDIVGYYASGTGDRANGGGYHPVAVERLLDTRSWGYGKLPAGYSVSIPVRYSGDLQNISALSVTVTAVRPTGTGYLTTWNNGASIPKTSTLNFNKASGVISNAAIVPAAYNESSCRTCATIAVLNVSSAPIDIVVDINGFFDGGALPAQVRYQPLASPTRIVDSRSGQGALPFGSTTTQTVATPTTVADYDTVAIDANITAVLPSTSTYVTAWPGFDGEPRPVASILNPNAHQTIANHAIVGLNYGNTFDLYNFAGVNNLLVDVSGTFQAFPPTPADQLPRTPGDAARPQLAAAARHNVAGIAPSAPHRA